MRGPAMSGIHHSTTDAMALAPAPGAPGFGVVAPGAVRSLVPLFLHCWHTMPEAGAAPVVLCERGENGFAVIASVLPGGRHLASGPFEAADVVASALAVLAARGPGVILPHAAALESPLGLVLLFADTTGGKSTLALSLAAAGWRLFGDDRLGLRRERDGSIGMALGLAPKLRLPLPPSAAALAEFATTRTRRGWPNLAYLGLGPEEQAAAGVEAPVAACLLLDRGGGAPALGPARPPELVRLLAESAAAPWLGPAEVLTAAVSHAGLPAYHLHYAEAAEAVPLIIERFGKPG